VTKPEWLGIDRKGSDLSLSELYWLSRYADWVPAAKKTENDVAEYLDIAQPDSRFLSTFDDSLDINKQCAQLLAELLDWDAKEIEHACQALTPPRATTSVQVDWLRRLQAASRQTGLSVLPLQQAAELNSESSFNAYQVVGGAVVAATRQNDMMPPS
jgi:hypothetical protein